MPCISAFYGISIYMYHVDHEPAHVHAVHGEHHASFIIDSGQRLNGSFPQRASRLVRSWLREHRTELLADWLAVRHGDAPQRIPPLE